MKGKDKSSYPRSSVNGHGLIRRQPNGYKVEQPKLGFGPHLMLDGYGCSRSRLEDMSSVYKTLDDLPSIINMTKIMPPYVSRYSGIKPEDWGISGFVLIAESHISLHTFPEKNFLSFDIFSCKSFEHEKAIEYLTKAYEIKKSEINTVQRGLEFPHYPSQESLQAGLHLAEVERRSKEPKRLEEIL